MIENPLRQAKRLGEMYRLDLDQRQRQRSKIGEIFDSVDDAIDWLLAVPPIERMTIREVSFLARCLWPESYGPTTPEEAAIMPVWAQKFHAVLTQKGI